MQAEVRVCVVGTGRAGMVHARNFRWHVPYASLVAIVDIEPERARQAASELDLGQAPFPTLDKALEMSDFDAVVITTPTFSHAELAVKAASSGKSILCEKPMALTLEECDRMIEAASQNQVVLQIGFMRRFDPPFVEAKRQIDDGLIGRPLVVRTLTRGPGLPPAWAHDIRRSHGILAEVNSHDFDCIRWFSGGEYVSVFARGATRKALEVQARYPEFYDTVVVSAELDNGVFAVLDGVCPVDYGYDARAEVVGTEGVLLVGEMHQTATTRVTRQSGLVEDHFLGWRERFAQAYANEATHFVEAIRGRRPPTATGVDGKRALEAVIAGNRSIATGQPVSWPLGS